MINNFSISIILVMLILLISCNSSKVITEEQSRQQNNNIKLVHATDNKVSLRSGDNYWDKAWTISPNINPHNWYVMPEENKTVRASFITDIDSISYEVKNGEIYNFLVVLNNVDTAYTQIKGIGPKVKFTEKYKSEYLNRTVIEIPKVYELINIAFALTSLSFEDDSHVVRKNIPYYNSVIEWFSPYKEHEVVTTLDSILRDQFNMYYILKLDSYAYRFDDDKIISKEIYDRIAQNYGENFVNTKLLNLLESFSQISNFQEFYVKHQELYNSQINYYREKVNIKQMQVWLNMNFPGTSYDCFKVIFSPLVDWNQSSTWFENNEFREAQSHVNFPYPSESDKKRTEFENILKDGEILFTELNHPFINPESEKYLETKEFNDAFSNLSFWIDSNSAASNGYSNSYSLFNELMNWSLVSLYHLDNAPSESAEKLIKSVEQWQTNGRGFKHFKPFNRNLIKLYKSKKDNETVADLYPNIINWCRDYFIENKE